MLEMFPGLQNLYIKIQFPYANHQRMEWMRQHREAWLMKARSWFFNHSRLSCITICYDTGFWNTPFDIGIILAMTADRSGVGIKVTKEFKWPES